MARDETARERARTAPAAVDAERDVSLAATVRERAAALGGAARQVVLRVWAGFGAHEISTRAAALTYVTLFSIVPTLAVAFAMFKAFGGLERAKAVLLPRLLDYLAVGSRDMVAARIEEFIANIHGGAIGGIGTIGLLIGALSLMTGIENALNRIWDVPASRSFIRRATMYWTTLTVTPTLVIGGASLPAAVASAGPVAWLLATPVGGVLVAVVLPLGLTLVGFTLLYKLVPNTHVPIRAALLGALVGGSLWLAAVQGYAVYASITVSYSRIYGSLGALALLLVWIYLSWVIVLIGAEVAASVQRLSTLDLPIEGWHLSATSRELVLVRVMTAIARPFVIGAPAPTADEIATDLALPRGLVRPAIAELAAAGFVLTHGEEESLVPARDPHRTTPADILAALRAGDDLRDHAPVDPTTRALADLQGRAEEAWHTSLAEVTLADLARDEPARTATARTDP